MYVSWKQGSFAGGSTAWQTFAFSSYCQSVGGLASEIDIVDKYVVLLTRCLVAILVLEEIGKFSISEFGTAAEC